jgi:hypothetical protein
MIHSQMQIPLKVLLYEGDKLLNSPGFLIPVYLLKLTFNENYATVQDTITLQASYSSLEDAALAYVEFAASSGEKFQYEIETLVEAGGIFSFDPFEIPEEFYKSTLITATVHDSKNVVLGTVSIPIARMMLSFIEESFDIGRAFTVTATCNVPVILPSLLVTDNLGYNENFTVNSSTEPKIEYELVLNEIFYGSTLYFTPLNSNGKSFLQQPAELQVNYKQTFVLKSIPAYAVPNGFLSVSTVSKDPVLATSAKVFVSQNLSTEITGEGGL